MVTFCNYLVNASKNETTQCNGKWDLLNILVLSLKSSTGSHFLVIFSGDTLWYRDLIKKLTVVQHAKKFPPFIDYKGL